MSEHQMQHYGRNIQQKSILFFPLLSRFSCQQNPPLATKTSSLIHCLRASSAIVQFVRLPQEKRKSTSATPTPSPPTVETQTNQNHSWFSKEERRWNTKNQRWRQRRERLLSDNGGDNTRQPKTKNGQRQRRSSITQECHKSNFDDKQAQKTHIYTDPSKHKHNTTTKP